MRPAGGVRSLAAMNAAFGSPSNRMRCAYLEAEVAIEDPAGVQVEHGALGVLKCSSRSINKYDQGAPASFQ